MNYPPYMCPSHGWGLKNVITTSPAIFCRLRMHGLVGAGIERLVDDFKQLVMLKHEEAPGLAKLTRIREGEKKPGRRRVSILVGNRGLYLPQEMRRGADGAAHMHGFFLAHREGMRRQALANLQRVRFQAGFVHLHVHSEFSLLDGMSKLDVLMAETKRLGMDSIALTDHDDLGGAVRFATTAATAGIGGIIGVELTVAVPMARVPSGAAARATDDTLLDTHLVLLAESREGYGNLSTLVTRARLDQWRGQPQVSLETLAAHSAGLFALTGCPRGWVPTLVARGASDAACAATATLLDIFDRRVALECWDHALPEERRTAILLYDVDGFDYAEIAELTGCSVGTVKSRISRGREELRRLLGGREAGTRQGPRSLRGRDD